MRKTITRGERKALEWFAARTAPAKLFGRGDPTLRMVARLRGQGMVEVVDVRPGQFASFQISKAGRVALKREKR